jgi:hypothetical protein
MSNPGTPFDPAARHVDQETGIEYEDFAAWLLRQSQDSSRNTYVRWYREQGYQEAAIEAYWRAYDAYVPERNALRDDLRHAERHEAGTRASVALGLPAIGAGYGWPDFTAERIIGSGKHTDPC